ncbi:glycosyltransferase family 4 protein [Desulfopila sp. IMCC35006]|uniref:glycosyltransferase family 4 protein n=1 Tax=Desulfopila sp. IMCC35006 TaxID=2569542 RepID=UPI0010AD016C|nr:glycosyltransferase family 4 protein [Desulfopila sp. IMCC35006]TKB26132.1 glycosyltransferase family 4 protein [Desulfopila sp. IMCC35006]
MVYFDARQLRHSNSIRILALTKYARLGASSRMRTWQYLPFLEKEGFEITVQPLLSDELLRLRYQRGFYGIAALSRAYADRCKNLLQCRKFDIVWIEKEALPWWPLWTERALLRGVPYVLDYDDAIFHNYDRHASSWVRRIYRRRLDGLMAGSALVIGGNRYLAKRAMDAGATWVEVVPTVIDLARYPVPAKTQTVDGAPDTLPRIVWIGSPSTVHYLHLIGEALQAVAEQNPFVLRIIGGSKIGLPGVPVEAMTWSEATETENIRGCAVGIMPLLDSPWERGKCGYKLIQYMACGLPVVASGVGGNPEIVKSGENGFIANNTDDWVNALQRLLGDRLLCARMGASGRRRVEETYCLQQTGPVVAGLLRTVVARHH